MRRITTLLGASALVLGPALGIAMPSYGAPPAPGSISPHHDTGQQVGVPGGTLDCEDGTPPGNSAEDHGNPNINGSPFAEGSSVSGSNYAGEKAQNQKNTTSISQYDVACFGGSPRPQ
jgi:hypothetical protein